MKEVFIVSAKRTPTGLFMGGLSSLTAPQLGAAAIKSAIESISLSSKEVQEVFMGNVLQGGVGQAPARQAALFAGLDKSTPATTINKVCASGMKAIMLGAQSIMLGENDCVVSGGMESMSQAPHYINNSRNGKKFGGLSTDDAIIKDGLTDVYNQTLMGVCAEKCASEHNISREAQDDFALESYRRSAQAWDKGHFKNEVCSVEIPQRKGDSKIVTKDEEYTNIKPERVSTLKPAFDKHGTVTAANASTLNDGASAVVLMSKEKLESLNLKPLAKIVSFADAAGEPEWFTTAPSKAIPKALNKAGLEISDIDYWELNQAFSVVGIANTKLLGLDSSKVDVNGGAVALGHALGNSGARIIVTLINVLKQNNGKLGGAGICNGGGGASAMIIEAC